MTFQQVYIPRFAVAVDRLGGAAYKREQNALRKWCKANLTSLRTDRSGGHGAIEGIRGYARVSGDGVRAEWKISLQGPTAEKDAVLLKLLWSDGFRP